MLVISLTLSERNLERKLVIMGYGVKFYLFRVIENGRIYE